jgi:hypothetical protein
MPAREKVLPVLRYELTPNQFLRLLCFGHRSKLPPAEGAEI